MPVDRRITISLWLILNLTSQTIYLTRHPDILVISTCFFHHLSKMDMTWKMNRPINWSTVLYKMIHVNALSARLSDITKTHQYQATKLRDVNRIMSMKRMADQEYCKALQLVDREITKYMDNKPGLSSSYSGSWMKCSNPTSPTWPYSINRKWPWSTAIIMMSLASCSSWRLKSSTRTKRRRYSGWRLRLLSSCSKFNRYNEAIIKKKMRLG